MIGLTSVEENVLREDINLPVLKLAENAFAAMEDSINTGNWTGPNVTVSAPLKTVAAVPGH